MRIKNLLIKTLLLLPLLGIGQEKATTPSFKRYSIGINISPDINYRNIHTTSKDETINFIVKERNKYEIAKIGFMSGINFSFFFKKNICITTGLNYANRGYETHALHIDIGGTPGGPEFAKFIYTYEFIDIPIRARFTLGSKKVRLTSSFGVLNNILLKQTTISSLQDIAGNYDKNGKLGGIFAKKNDPVNIGSNYRAINFSAILSAGVNLKLTELIFIEIEPTFNYVILNSFDKAPISEHLWSMGLNVGLNYAF